MTGARVIPGLRKTQVENKEIHIGTSVPYTDSSQGLGLGSAAGYLTGESGSYVLVLTINNNNFHKFNLYFYHKAELM